MRRARFLALATVLAGCVEQLPLENQRETTVLIGVVVAGADSVFIALGRTGSAIDVAGESGAHLTLTTDGSDLPLEEGPAGACGAPAEFTCYRARLDGRARPGNTLRLRGTLASGVELQGEALVPEVPNITIEGGVRDTVHVAPNQPAQLLGLQDAPFRIDTAIGCPLGPMSECFDIQVDATVWANGEARICRVQLPGPPSGQDLRTYERVSLTAGAPVCPDAPDLAWDSAAVAITLLGYDRNFTDWAAADEKLPETIHGWGIEGVHGVFGAATPREFVLAMRPER